MKNKTSIRIQKLGSIKKGVFLLLKQACKACIIITQCNALGLKTQKILPHLFLLRAESILFAAILQSILKI